MRATINDEDEGKPVVDANGDEIGIIKRVDGGTAYVDPDPGITDKVMSRFGWGDVDDDNYPVEASRVDVVTDDEVRLKS